MTKRGNDVSKGPGTAVGGTLLAEGAFLAVGAQVLFHACGATETGMYMRCHYSQQAVSVAGAVVALLAVAVILVHDARLRRALSLASAASGLVVIGIPTILVGVCPMPTMVCHALLLPSSVLLGALIAATGVVGWVAFGHREGRGHAVASGA